MGAEEQRVDRADKRAGEARERAEAALRREEETRDVAGDFGGEAPEVDEPDENPPTLRQ